MTTFLTAYAERGYADAVTASSYRNPHLSSSPAGMAFDVGRWFRRTMTPRFDRLRMSRGFTLVAEYGDGSTIKLRWLGNDRVERVA
jgi:hypothetical protein